MQSIYNDSDRDIAYWISSFEGSVLDCFNIEISNEEDTKLYSGMNTEVGVPFHAYWVAQMTMSQPLNHCAMNYVFFSAH